MNAPYRHPRGLLLLFLALLTVFSVFTIESRYVTAEGGGYVYSDVFTLQPYDSRYYLVYLNESEKLEVNVEPEFGGNFDIFIYDFRPTESYVTFHGYDPEIFNRSILYNVTRDPSAYVNFTAPRSRVYYIQVVLIGRLADTFYLNATKKLEVYIIPFIGGYSLTGIAFGAITGLILLVIRYKRNKQKIGDDGLGLF